GASGNRPKARPTPGPHEATRRSLLRQDGARSFCIRAGLIRFRENRRPLRSWCHLRVNNLSPQVTKMMGQTLRLHPKQAAPLSAASWKDGHGHDLACGCPVETRARARSSERELMGNIAMIRIMERRIRFRDTDAGHREPRPIRATFRSR